MKLIIGIGNPGEKYEGTRHNVGELVLDKLKQEISKSEFLNSKQIPNTNFQFSKKLQAETVKFGDVILAKPTSFMNESGVAVSKLVTMYKVKLSKLWIIHDDLDIKIGQYKIQLGVGPKEHNGLNSIYEKLGTPRNVSGQAKDFWHVRIGVDNRDPDKRIPGEQYVLQKFLSDEKEVLDKVTADVTKELMVKLQI